MMVWYLGRDDGRLDDGRLAREGAVFLLPAGSKKKARVRADKALAQAGGTMLWRVDVGTVGEDGLELWRFLWGFQVAGVLLQLSHRVYLEFLTELMDGGRLVERSMSHETNTSSSTFSYGRAETGFLTLTAEYQAGVEADPALALLSALDLGKRHLGRIFALRMAYLMEETFLGLKAPPKGEPHDSSV